MAAGPPEIKVGQNGTMTDITSKVRTFIHENFTMGSTAVQFTDTDSFMGRHLIDSTGFLELVTYLEETWGIRVEDQEMVPENLDSLQAIEAYVSRKLAAVTQA
jgi:acyl carrier protein